MFGLGGSEWGVLGAIALLSTLWFWMLLDALIHEDSPAERVLWVLLIFFTWVPGALAYALLRLVPRKRRAWKRRSSAAAERP